MVQGFVGPLSDWRGPLHDHLQNQAGPGAGAVVGPDLEPRRIRPGGRRAGGHDPLNSGRGWPRIDWREKMDGKRFRLYAAGVVALLGVAALPGGAEAVKVLNISAASFVAAASDVDQVRAGGNFAVLSGEGKFFANVPIENGRVKRFTLF